MKKTICEAIVEWFKYDISNSPLMDNIVLKLCYKWTVSFLVLFSFVISSAILFGDSLACFTSVEKFPSDYLNLKCYYNSTYILPSTLPLFKDVVFLYGYSLNNYRKYQSYYPWVNWYFLVNACTFFILHFVWKWYESKHLNKLFDSLQMFPNNKRECHNIDLSYIAKYVFIFKGKHKLYAALYIHFEIVTHAMCFASTLCLVYFFDTVGVPEAILARLGTWSDFRDIYFPTSGMCKFTVFNGQLVKAMCEMPLNRLFMFMFLFLFGWYILITILSGMVIIYRIALMLPSVREFMSKVFISTGKQPILNYFDQSNWSYCDCIFMSRFEKAVTDANFDQMLEKIDIAFPEKDQKLRI